MTVWRRKMVSARDEPHYWFSNAGWSTLKPYIHTQPTKMDSEGCVCMYMRNNKKAYQLGSEALWRDLREGIWEGGVM